MTRLFLLAGAAAAVLACGRPVPQAAAADTAPPAPRAAPPDTLLYRTRAGVEVWFTLARHDSAPGGSACLERTVEIRREGRRVPVPLLYTGAVPVLLNDTTLRADLWAHCAPSAPYRVDLRTGQPTREGRR